MLAIDSRKGALDRFFSRAALVEDREVQADLAKLGAVLACGFLERSVEIVIMERIENRAKDRVKNFIKSHFKRGNNYDCVAICGLLERFDLSWSEKMKVWMNKNPGPVESISSIYGLRNSIAHGGGQAASLLRVKAYAEDAKLTIDAVIISTR